MFYYDPTYLMLIPGMIVSFWAQHKVKKATQDYARVSTRCGLTGLQVAQSILQENGISGVSIEVIDGNLTDHYDPSSRTLRLSRSVANSTSITALGIAAHETGHVLQHCDAYKPLMLRSASAASANIGSGLSWPLILVGLIFNWQPLISAGILLFTLMVLFTLITLPVEFNASHRALNALSGGGYLTNDELNGAQTVLSAAAMTYVASAFTAVLQLLRLLTISNRRSRR